jgi:hypothetical protein
MDYVISGECLNSSYLYAVEMFNRETAHNPPTQFNYAEAFWNGYAAAIAGVQAIVADRTLDSEVL